MQKLVLSLFFLFSLSAYAKVGDRVDCSSAYMDVNQKVSCEVVKCNDKFKTFLGSWEGPFEVYSQDKNAYRPYRNQIKYYADDCLENIEQGHSGFGDNFIIGRRTDLYPAFQNLPSKVEFGLLITGRNRTNQPFLRTIDSSNNRVDYQLESQDAPSETSIWSTYFKKAYEDACPNDASKKCFYDMKFTTSDGKPTTDPSGKTRNVSVKMEMFLSETGEKIIESVSVKGHHTLQN